MDSRKLALIDSTAYKMNALMKEIIRATIDQTVTPLELMSMIQKHRTQTELFSNLLDSVPSSKMESVKKSVLETISASEIQLSKEEKDFMINNLPNGLFE